MPWEILLESNGSRNPDTTDVNQLRTHLKRVEHGFTDLFIAINKSSIISRTDLKGNITYVNQNFLEVSGYSEQELIGQPHNIINSGFHPKVFWKNVWAQIGKGKIWRGEVCNKGKGGKIYWVDTFIYPCYNEQGKLVSYFSIRNDITSRKNHEQALHRSQNLLRSIFDSTNDIYLLVSPELNLLAFNNEAQKTFGATDTEAAVRLLLRMQDGFSQRFENALRGVPVELEREVTMLDGTKQWFKVKYLPAFDREGDIVGVSINLSNIHLRKLQELELIRQNEALTKIGWLQSHEIRRPVTSILGLIQLLEMEPVVTQDSQLLAHLKKMTQELDEKTRQIVKLTI